MKLLIAIPTNDYMHYQFCECLTKLVRRLDEDEIDYDIAFQGATLVYVGRDRLTKKAIEGGFSHVLWLDSDMIFTEDLHEDLMFSGKGFVTGIAHSRRPPHVSCLFRQIWPIVDRWDGNEYPSGPFKVGGCGFGCVLIKTDIMKAVFDKHGTAFFPMRELGEDLAFCQRVHDCGHKIYCEPGVRVGHIGHIAIYPDDREYWANLGGMTK